MGFLRKLFGGGNDGQSSKNSRDPNGMYFYVNPKMCEEIVKVRIDLRNDLSETDDGGYFVRKVVQAARCPFAAELHVSLDGRRRIVQVGVENGKTVEEDEYEAWLAQQEQTP